MGVVNKFPLACLPPEGRERAHRTETINRFQLKALDHWCQIETFSILANFRLHTRFSNVWFGVFVCFFLSSFRAIKLIEYSHITSTCWPYANSCHIVCCYVYCLGSNLSTTVEQVSFDRPSFRSISHRIKILNANLAFPISFYEFFLFQFHCFNFDENSFKRHLSW